MKKIIVRLLNTVTGKTRFQGFYEALLKVSLVAMNYGDGEFRTSGELNVFSIIKKKFKNKKDLVIFDVGGNVGNYSKSLALFFGSNTTIHSFEPSKKTFKRFVETTTTFSNIIPYNFGFGEAEDKMLLYTDTDFSGLASVYQRNLKHFGVDMDASEEISITTIDKFCSSSNINHIHFLKLDIEGHELKALIGAKKMIMSKKIDMIQFEFGGCNIDSRTYFRDFFYLLKEDYKIYRILKDGLFELNQYKESYEIFLNVNYLAIRKS